MFSILVKPSAPITEVQTAPFTRLLSSTDVLGVPITYIPEPVEDNVSAIAIPESDTTFTDGIISFIAPSTTENISSIYIGDTTYTIALDSSNPVEGEFIFDWDTKQVKVTVGENSQTTTVIYPSNILISGATPLNGVNLIQVFGQTYTLTASANPSQNQFIYNNDTNQVLLYIPENLAILNLTEITINNFNYILASTENTPPGQFSFLYLNPPVTITTVINPLERSPLIIKQSTSKIETKSTCIPLTSEPLLDFWNAESITPIQFGFEAEPQGWTFTFIDCRDRLDYIEAELNKDLLFNVFGYRWRVNNISWQELDFNQIRVSVDMAYYLASHGDPSKSPLDENIKLKKRLSSTSFRRSRSLGEIATLAGTTYTGENLSIRVPRSTSVTSTTTLRQEVTKRARNAHGYTHYGKNGIEIRPWRESSTHVINESDLREKPSFSHPGKGSWLSGVRLAREIRNQKVELNFDEDNKSDKEGVTQEWIFENCDSLFELYQASQKSLNGVLISPSVEILRSPGINFDAGGSFGKRGTKVTRVNGTVTFEERIDVDYAFSSDEVHLTEITAQGNLIIKLNTATFPQTYFKVVHQSTSDWIFDKDGYLTDIKISGFEVARLQQETPLLEAAIAAARARQNATNGIDDPQFLAIAQGYQFTENLPLSDNTKYTLQKHRDYFDDVVQPAECEEDGWVEPKWAQSMTRFREDVFVKDNPKSTEAFTYPPIQSGKYYKETQRTGVVSTEPDRYETRTRTRNNEGEYFKDGRAEGKNQYSDGKPPVHTRLDNTFDYSPNVINPNYDVYRNQNYYLSSPGVFDGDVKLNEGGISYPDIDNPNEVKAIAQTDLSIDNSRDSFTASIDIHWRSDIEVGDFAIFRGQKWKIFNISDNKRIDGAMFVSDSYQLTLGRYLEPSLEMENRRYC